VTLASEQVVQDRYRIVSLLGQGGMGAVYRAWDTRLSITVAIKEMISQPGLDPQTLDQLGEQFRQEAETLARMHHPHLVRVTDFFAEDGNAYLVMDFVDGESLARRIEQQGALLEAQVLEWADQLLEALAYCHAQGVIHRDVKPQNVIIRPGGQATLVDFGLVKLWDSHDPRTRTAMRGLGTPEYAPPEQYDDTMGHTGPHSDIYSLGATLYHALTGQAPPTATMRIANPDKLLPPRASNPRLSPRTDAAVLRAIELAVGNRFATAQEMAAALRGDAPAPTPPVAPTRLSIRVIPRTQSTLPDRRKRTPAWGWILGILFVLAVAAGLVGAALIARGRTGSTSGASTPTPQVEETAVAAALAGVEETPTPLIFPSPRRTATHTSTPTRTPTPRTSPTGTPAGTPRSTPKGKPTSTPTSTPSAGATPTPRPTSPSGTLFTFEQWTTWQRGDQPYGELTQTQEQVQSGHYAAKLGYDFPVSTEDYVVFVHSLSLTGQPNTAGAWVYGDGSGHLLNVWVQDAQDEIWSVHLGRVGGSGWRQMVGTLDPSLSWPTGHVSGPDNGVIDYPIRFYALVLDRPGSGPRSGQIYIDDVSVWHSTASATATPPPGATATPTATAESPVSAGPLDFPEPTRLDAWEPAEGDHEATIILHISGGAPPFTIYHDMTVFTTEEREYPLVFTASGCSIIHSITVESADGQSVSHDYFIRSPWCD
jgi:serine/threonine-protein kinase